MTVSKDWQIMPKDLFAMGPIVPVLIINKVTDALPIAEALLAADVRVLEVTLRTPAALDVISLIAKEL
ncbi:MAG: keto-deoxy-phosphogluconate aldolase, partial [Colwellia sp.]